MGRRAAGHRRVAVREEGLVVVEAGLRRAGRELTLFLCCLAFFGAVPASRGRLSEVVGVGGSVHACTCVREGVMMHCRYGSHSTVKDRLFDPAMDWHFPGYGGMKGDLTAASFVARTLPWAAACARALACASCADIHR